MNAARATAASTVLDSALARTRGLQRSEHRLLLTLGDAACAAGAVVLALWAWSITTGFAFDTAFLNRSAAWLVLVPAWTLLLAKARQVPAALSLESTVTSLFGSAGALLVVYAALYFYAPPRALPRLPAVYFFWDVTLLTLGWRLIYLHVFTGSAFRRRAAVIGAGTAAARMIALLHEHAPDVEVVAVIDDDSQPLGYADVPMVGSSELERVVKDHAVSEVIVTSNSPSPDLVQSLVRWQQQGVTVVPMAAEYEHLLMRVPVAFLPPDWMFTSLSEWVRTRDASRAVKRLVDIVGALIGIAILMVAVPIVAVSIWADSARPIFYRQRRLGAGGRPFTVIKFRTMVTDAEEDGPQWAGTDDTRVTRVGRWLRRTRVDELPQVINVLRGDMSLVGPRPERPEFVAQLENSIPVYRARLMVRPGLTGWAQINADYAASAAEATLKLEYDLYYIKHRSFLFDMWILLKTAVTVLTLRGR